SLPPSPYKYKPASTSSCKNQREAERKKSDKSSIKLRDKMRPTTNVASTAAAAAAAATATATAARSAANGMMDSGFRWNSPIPYLFGGLALMVGLIAVALIILACSYKKSSSDGDDGNKEPGEMVAVKLDNEPKVVVIMAGDDNPTYLAKPVPAATNCQQV
ncbi:hypothetical protein Ancab_006499, partial [Ancistrocladus abbreviatus]